MAGGTSKKAPFVVIVGGGVAGLVAAQAVKNGGGRPLVLEARARVGGRVLTTRLGGAQVPFATLANRGLPEGCGDEADAPAVDIGASVMHGCGDANQFVLERAFAEKIRAPVVAGGTGYESTECAAWFDSTGRRIPQKEISTMHRVARLANRYVGGVAYAGDDPAANLREIFNIGVDQVIQFLGRSLSNRETLVLEKILARMYGYCAPLSELALCQTEMVVDKRTVHFQIGMPYDEDDPPKPGELQLLDEKEIAAEAKMWDKILKSSTPPKTPRASMRGGPGDRIVLDGYTPFLVDQLTPGIDIRLETIVKAITVPHAPVPETPRTGSLSGPWCVGYTSASSRNSVRTSGAMPPVRASRPSKPEVHVTTSTGEVIKCDFVIVTLPLGVLQGNHPTSRVTFSPPLSEDKRMAINGFGMGVHNKVVLKFKEEDVFWPINVPQLNCTDPRFQFFNLHAYGKTGVLVAHVFNETGFARGYDNMSDEQVVAEVMSVLHNAFCGRGVWTRSLKEPTSTPLSSSAASASIPGQGKTPSVTESPPVPGQRQSPRTVRLIGTSVRSPVAPSHPPLCRSTRTSRRLAGLPVASVPAASGLSGRTVEEVIDSSSAQDLGRSKSKSASPVPLRLRLSRQLPTQAANVASFSVGTRRPFLGSLPLAKRIRVEERPVKHSPVIQVNQVMESTPLREHQVDVAHVYGPAPKMQSSEVSEEVLDGSGEIGPSKLAASEISEEVLDGSGEVGGAENHAKVELRDSVKIETSKPAPLENQLGPIVEEILDGAEFAGTPSPEQSTPTDPQKCVRLPQPEHYIVTRWDSDPFSLGSYSYMPCGADFEFIDMLGKPERMGTDKRIVFFGGEHTSAFGWQCVHGAYESGLVAAHGVLAEAGLVPKGSKPFDLDKNIGVSSQEGTSRVRNRKRVKNVGEAKAVAEYRSVSADRIRMIARDFAQSPGHFFDVLDEMVHRLREEDEQDGVAPRIAETATLADHKFHDIQQRKGLWQRMHSLAVGGDLAAARFLRLRHLAASMDVGRPGIQYKFRTRRRKDPVRGMRTGDLTEHIDLLHNLIRNHEVFSLKSATRAFATQLYERCGAIVPLAETQDWVKSTTVFKKANLPVCVRADTSLESATEKASRKLKLKSLEYPTLQYFKSKTTLDFDDIIRSSEKRNGKRSRSIARGSGEGEESPDEDIDQDEDDIVLVPSQKLVPLPRKSGAPASAPRRGSFSSRGVATIRPAAVSPGVDVGFPPLSFSSDKSSSDSDSKDSRDSYSYSDDDEVSDGEDSEEGSRKFSTSKSRQFSIERDDVSDRSSASESDVRNDEESIEDYDLDPFVSEHPVKPKLELSRIRKTKPSSPSMRKRRRTSHVAPESAVPDPTAALSKRTVSKVPRKTGSR